MNALSKCSLLAAFAACAASSIAAAAEPGPDWLLRPSRSPVDVPMQSVDEVLLVLQRERSDGTELLTLRIPIVEFGSVLAYAGAGVNRTVYFAETSAGESRVAADPVSLGISLGWRFR